MPFTEQRIILVVDDEKIIADTFHRAFDDQNKFVIDVAETVSMAIQKVRAIFYDLIFIDMNLEGNSLGGMEVLEALREVEIETEAKGKPVKIAHVVIMSGSVCLNDFSKKANALQVFAFIDKPTDFSPEFIRRVVNKLGLPLMPREV